MKKYLLISAAALALASCSSDDFLGGKSNTSQSSSNVIGFGTNAPNFTREFGGPTAAEKLNNNFIVYGFKYYTTEPFTAGNPGVDNPAEQQKVFDRYNVDYTLGTAGTTESNTTNWEYVGLKSVAGEDQTIKYWDYETTGYVFSAVSGTGITAEKIESVADGPTADGAPVTPMAWSAPTLTREEGATADEYDKGWVVTIPAGGSLSDLYASERVEVLKANYQNTVSLKFYNLGARVRFGLYETIPGYKVSIDKFYYNGTNSITNFGVDGDFTVLKNGADSKLIVTYYNSGTLENHPKVTPLDGSADKKTYGEFGTNIQAASEIGTASNKATYDQADGLYTDIIPMTGNGMDLKIDYTLTATDNSGETIHVKGATARVPENFTDWKANFAYTYLFKISDNTNGTTGTGSDPVGLFPITFDAVVVANEDGIQETITSVSDPSITTYQNGIVVTENNEYKAGDIYFEKSDLSDISSTYKVYEVNNLTGNSFETQANMTEEVVANYLNNFCVLTEVSVTWSADDDFILLSDGTYLHKASGVAGKFTAEAGKTYAIANGSGQYKLVKIGEGSYSVPTFTMYTDAIAGSATTLTLGGFDASDNANPTTGNLYLAEGGVGVIGAMPLITVTPDVAGNNGLKIVEGSTAGEYDLSISADAVNAGTAKGTYTVKFNGGNDVTVTIDKTNKLWDNAATPAALSAAAVTAGGSAITAVLKIDNAASNTGVIVNEYEDKGVTVTNTGSNGEYTISATQNAKPGVYNIKIAGETVAVTVTNYEFAQAAYTYTLTTGDALIAADGTPATIVLNVLAGNVAATASTVAAANVDVTGANLTLTGTGTFTPSAAYSAAGGEHTLTYPNTAAEATVTINKYAIDGGTIALNTGRVELGVTVNTKEVNGSAARVKITKNADGSDQTANFTITANGKKIVISGAKSTLATGAYTVHYYLENAKTNEVATSALTVN